MNEHGTRRCLAWLAPPLLGLLSAMSGCVPAARHTAAATPLREAGQLVVVVTPDWNADHGTLRTFDRDAGGAWRAAGLEAPVMVGREGIAWGAGLHPAGGEGPVKREGDGRAPAGIFALGAAFGYAADAATAMPYEAMDEHDYCIDVADSPLYNRIVDVREVGAAAIEGTTEPMRRDLHVQGDQRYRLGLVIRHNQARRAGGGSCIFAHLWLAPGVATAGCTAMDDGTMRTLLGWLRPAATPRYVLLPRPQYAALQRDWGLPPLP
jgi:L,D-peptidoglycan transpeptidase YkuD (ErfK/YbiS/YcfS/YnhG family)